MSLTKKQIAEYQKIYFKYYGKKINKEEAFDNGIKLINLLTILIKNKHEINQK